MCSRGKTGSGGSFSAVHSKPISSDAASGANSPILLGQPGRDDAAFLVLGKHLSDERTNRITDALPSGGAKSHSEPRTGESTSPSFQSRLSLLIVARPVSLSASLGSVLCLLLLVCLRFRRKPSF